MIRKILITGFEPFNQDVINPSAEVVKRLPASIKDVELIRRIIPTVRYRALDVIKDAILKEKPDVIVSIGQAGGRPMISVERIAINVDDFRIPDNQGNQPIDEPINKAGPAAYFSALPIKAMVQAVLRAGIPAQVTNSAGTFVCNHVFYGVADFAATSFPELKTGFIHIPYMEEQVLDKPGEPSMHLEEMVRGIESAIEAIINHPDADCVEIGGSLD
mgnify:CR=1 FL=1